mgnify:CR=1 FL=1
MNEIMPLLAKALGTGEKKPAPPMKKVRRSKPRKLAPKDGVYVCKGCGYEYDPDLGDPIGEIDPGTSDHFNYNTQELHPDRSNTEGVSFILLGIHKMQYYSREDVLT